MRTERPFRLLAETPKGEKYFEADVVVDASEPTGCQRLSAPAVYQLLEKESCLTGSSAIWARSIRELALSRARRFCWLDMVIRRPLH